MVVARMKRAIMYVKLTEQSLAVSRCSVKAVTVLMITVLFVWLLLFLS